MHRTTLGDLELTILSDGEYYLDGGTFFGVIPKIMWQRKWAPDEMNRLRAGLNSVLIRGGEKTILIQTGIGNKLNEKMQKIYGHEEKLLTSLEAAGYRQKKSTSSSTATCISITAGGTPSKRTASRCLLFRTRIITCRRASGVTENCKPSVIASVTSATTTIH